MDAVACGSNDRVPAEVGLSPAAELAASIEAFREELRLATTAVPANADAVVRDAHRKAESALGWAVEAWAGPPASAGPVDLVALQAAWLPEVRSALTIGRAALVRLAVRQEEAERMAAMIDGLRAELAVARPSLDPLLAEQHRKAEAALTTAHTAAESAAADRLTRVTKAVHAGHAALAEMRTRQQETQAMAEAVAALSGRCQAEAPQIAALIDLLRAELTVARPSQDPLAAEQHRKAEAALTTARTAAESAAADRLTRVTKAVQAGQTALAEMKTRQQEARAMAEAVAPLREGLAAARERARRNPLAEPTAALELYRRIQLALDQAEGARQSTGSRRYQRLVRAVTEGRQALDELNRGWSDGAAGAAGTAGAAGGPATADS